MDNVQGKQHKKFIILYAVLFLLVIILGFLVFLLIKNVKNPNQLINFYSAEQQVDYSIFIKPGNDQLYNHLKNNILDSSSNPQELEIVFNEAYHDGELSVSQINFRGEKEIVIASKYKNNIIETTSFEKLIYEEKIVFYSKNTELLKIIEQNLNNKEINSFWRGMKQNIILSLVDFYGEIDSQIFFGKNDNDLISLFIQDKKIYNDIYNLLFRKNIEQELPIEILASFNPEIDNVVAIEDYFESFSISQLNINSLLSELNNVYLVKNSSGNLISFFDSREIVDQNDLVLSFDKSAEENVIELLKDTLKIRIPEIITSADENIEYNEIVVRDLIPEPLEDVVNGLDYKYYYINDIKLVLFSDESNLYVLSNENLINIFNNLDNGLDFTYESELVGDYFYGLLNGISEIKSKNSLIQFKIN